MRLCSANASNMRPKPKARTDRELLPAATAPQRKTALAQLKGEAFADDGAANAEATAERLETHRDHTFRRCVAARHRRTERTRLHQPDRLLRGVHARSRSALPARSNRGA